MLELLHVQGFDAESIEDLVKKFAPLKDVVVEILLDALRNCMEDRMCESYVRALAASEQPFDGKPLVACLQRTSDESLRWAVINTVALAKPHSIDDWLDGASKTQ